jgi:hypothetical protein
VDRKEAPAERGTLDLIERARQQAPPGVGGRERRRDDRDREPGQTMPADVDLERSRDERPFDEEERDENDDPGAEVEAI